MGKIILASGSKRRRELLEKLGIDFFVEKSCIEEKFDRNGNPKKIVAGLSEEKAACVAEKHKGEDIIIIGADTLVEYKGEIIGKPKDKKEAEAILRKLSGNAHTIYTGFTILNPKSNKKITKVEQTEVFFRKLTNMEIQDYVNSGEPFGKAGGYEIRGKAAVFVKMIKGDFYNVVGLPLCSLTQKLKEFIL